MGKRTTPGDKKPRPKQRSRLPGEYFKRSVVTVAPQTQTARTTNQDERNILLGQERVIVETRRIDGNWACHVEWIGHDRTAHVEDLPHLVMSAIYRHREQIIKEGQKDKGRKAAALRTHKAPLEEVVSDQVKALGL